MLHPHSNTSKIKEESYHQEKNNDKFLSIYLFNAFVEYEGGGKCSSTIDQKKNMILIKFIFKFKR